MFLAWYENNGSLRDVLRPVCVCVFRIKSQQLWGVMGKLTLLMA